MAYTYSDVRFYEWMISETLKQKPDADLSPVKDRVIEMKRQIRRRNKKESERRTIVHDGGDDWIFKFPLPEDIQTREEAIEYFKEYEYIYYRPTYYDCTGQQFTSWFKVFQKPDGRFWAYHCVSLDV